MTFQTPAKTSESPCTLVCLTFLIRFLGIQRDLATLTSQEYDSDEDEDTGLLPAPPPGTSSFHPTPQGQQQPRDGIHQIILKLFLNYA
jgi:hypothetical protein